MNTIQIGPELAANLTDCEVGVPETILVTITPTAIDDTGITAEITDATYAENEVEEPEAPAAPPAKRPAAVAAIMGGGKKY